MHTQHVKSSAYVAWGSGVGALVAVGVDFEEGEVAGLDDADEDVAESVLEVVAVVVCCLPSPSLLLVSFSVVLLDCIDTTEGLTVFSVLFRNREKWFRGTCSVQPLRTQDSTNY